MATRKKTEPKKTAAEDMQAFVDGLGTHVENVPDWQMAHWKKMMGPQESMESVDDRYNAIIERCGLNMPLLLQEILRELMYLRSGK